MVAVIQKNKRCQPLLWRGLSPPPPDIYLSTKVQLVDQLQVTGVPSNIEAAVVNEYIKCRILPDPETTISGSVLTGPVCQED